MTRRTPRLVVLATSVLALGVLTPTTAPPATAVASGNWIDLHATGSGYHWRGASHFGSRLVVTVHGNRLRFVDSRARKLLAKPRQCTRLRVPRGIGLSCPVPGWVSARHRMRVTIAPRLGNDHINASSLPRRFNLSVLADAGHDVVRLGAGNDFVNGASGNDRVHGGPGHDWIRTGLGNDLIMGGRGNDRLVGVQGRDRVYGGPGRDRVGGGPSNDQLAGGRGRDALWCGSGRDVARRGPGDRAWQCERVKRD